MTAVSAARLSLVVGAAVLGLKWLAWWLTGSVALYSDALESVVNVVAAAAALAAVTISRRPADATHAFGHTKAEYFSAVLEGVLIVLAALAIVREAWGRFADPQPVTGLDRGLAVSVVASLANGALAWYLVRLGRRQRSPALEADGIHLATDVVTSVGVVIGIVLAAATGYWVLDPLLAMLVAVNILWAGWTLVRDSLSGLMDAALPPRELAPLQGLLAEAPAGALEIHDLKTRRAGRATFVEFHLVVDGAMPVEEAHRLCDGLEAEVHELLPGSEVVIHVEPESEAHGDTAADGTLRVAAGEGTRRGGLRLSHGSAPE